MSRETCVHGVDVNGIITCLDCEQEIVADDTAARLKAAELKLFLAEGKIALLETMLRESAGRWTSVDDMLPPIAGIYFCKIRVAFSTWEESATFDGEEFSKSHVTHWMEVAS